MSENKSYHSWREGWRELFLAASHRRIWFSNNVKQQFYVHLIFIKLSDIIQSKIECRGIQRLLFSAWCWCKPAEGIVSDAFCGRRWTEVKGCWWQSARTSWWMLIRGWCAQGQLDIFSVTDVSFKDQSAQKSSIYKHTQDIRHDEPTHRSTGISLWSCYAFISTWLYQKNNF